MINDEAISLIKHFESLHDGDLSKVGLQPKMCPAKVWTAGWGHALTDEKGKFLKGLADKNKAYAHKLANLTVEQADELLDTDLIKFEKSVDGLVKATINENQRSALVSLTFNIGAGNFKTSTLLKKLNAGDYQGAAKEFCKWDKSDGIVMAGLIARRAKEEALFLKAV